MSVYLASSVSAPRSFSGMCSRLIDRLTDRTSTLSTTSLMWKSTAFPDLPTTTACRSIKPSRLSTSPTTMGYPSPQPPDRPGAPPAMSTDPPPGRVSQPGLMIPRRLSNSRVGTTSRCQSPVTSGCPSRWHSETDHASDPPIKVTVV
jgi:hypothetical protein